jgi:hypothetical protein
MEAGELAKTMTNLRSNLWQKNYCDTINGHKKAIAIVLLVWH